MKFNPKKAEKMRYQPNTLSFGLIMLSMLTSIIALFTVITYDSFENVFDALRVIPDFRIGLEIGLGILTLLVSFLTAEKVKSYHPFWSCVVVFVLAGINFWRMNDIPIYIYRNMQWVPRSVAVTAMIEFAVAGGLMALAGIIATFKVLLIRKSEKELSR